jgi:D-tyrosyl-tRNA(Tyr) deacylase
MRVLIQRVSSATVEFDGEVFSSIGPGLLLFVGIEEADGDEDMEWLAGKIARLRIFDDEAGVMNLDILQSNGDVLAVSQFTLHASVRKGNRPSYIRSARPEISKPLYEKFVARMSDELGGREVRTGVFGADMKVSLVNDGPVTIWIDSKHRE